MRCARSLQGAEISGIELQGCVGAGRSQNDAYCHDVYALYCLWGVTLAWAIPRTMLGVILERPCWSGPKTKRTNEAVQVIRKLRSGSSLAAQMLPQHSCAEH